MYFRSRRSFRGVGGSLGGLSSLGLGDDPDNPDAAPEESDPGGGGIGCGAGEHIGTISEFPYVGCVPDVGGGGASGGGGDSGAYEAAEAFLSAIAGGLKPVPPGAGGDPTCNPKPPWVETTDPLFPCVHTKFSQPCGAGKVYDPQGVCVTSKDLSERYKDYVRPGDGKQPWEATKPSGGGGGGGTVVKPKPAVTPVKPPAKAGMGTGTIVFGLLVAAGAAVIGKKMWDKKHGRH